MLPMLNVLRTRPRTQENNLLLEINQVTYFNFDQLLISRNTLLECFTSVLVICAHILVVKFQFSAIIQ